MRSLICITVTTMLISTSRGHVCAIDANIASFKNMTVGIYVAGFTFNAFSKNHLNAFLSLRRRNIYKCIYKYACFIKAQCSGNLLLKEMKEELILLIIHFNAF